MGSLRKLILPLAALLAAAAGYLTAYALRDTGVDVAQVQTVEFRFPDLDGKPRAAGEWRGRTVLLNFWATWCPPCREEIPLLLAAHERYAARGFEVVGIAVDQADAVLAYSESMGIGYPILIGDDDQVSSLMAKLGNRTGGLPYSVLLSPKGDVLSSKGGSYSEAELVRAIEAALPPSPGNVPK